MEWWLGLLGKAAMATTFRKWQRWTLNPGPLTWLGADRLGCLRGKLLEKKNCWRGKLVQPYYHIGFPCPSPIPTHTHTIGHMWCTLSHTQTRVRCAWYAHGTTLVEFTFALTHLECTHSINHEAYSNLSHTQHRQSTHTDGWGRLMQICAHLRHNSTSIGHIFIVHIHVRHSEIHTLLHPGLIFLSLRYS